MNNIIHANRDLLIYLINEILYVYKILWVKFLCFDWKENLWGTNFHGHGGMVGTIVRFVKYASYCGLIFVDKRHTKKSTKIYTP